MSDEELIVPSGIPQFTGNVDTLVTDAKTMTSDAKLFRDSGASVHSTFQGLQACYKAPEAEKLFATTAPVATKASAFASDLEKVSGALSTYASEIRPLAKKLGDLKDEAIAFVKSVEGDDHWRRDQKKVDHNNNLWRSVNATVSAFTDAERSCHDKIVALVGGEKLIADDGSHKPNMYGYKASDLDHAEQTPWGSLAEREYTGIAWLGHQIKSFVWDGFIVDGVWGTIKGLGTLVGTDGWDKAGQAWTGLAKLATGLVITASPLGAAYWLAPEDKLPSWLRDSRTAMKETGKALVAYDQWGKNPARAAGGVTFNVLTTVFTGGSGAAAKGGAVAKTVGALGKVAKVVDPMTYVGKAGKFAFVKVGDLMSGLKNLRVGSTVHLAEDAFKLPGEGVPLPKRPPNLPESAVPFLADGDKVVYLDKNSSRFFDAQGKELQAATKELSADERAAKAAAERPKQPQHSTVSDHEKVPVAAGVHTGGDGAASAARGGEHIPGGGHGPSGSAGHVPGGGTGGHVPGGAAGHTPGGGIGGHTPGGGAQHIPGAGSGGHLPGGAAHDLGRGPSASHEVPGTGGGNGSHTPTHSSGGGGGHDLPGTGHDTPSSGTSGHNGGGDARPSNTHEGSDSHNAEPGHSDRHDDHPLDAASHEPTEHASEAHPQDAAHQQRVDAPGHEPDLSRPALPPGRGGLTLEEVRKMRDKKTRWSAGEEFHRTMYGSGGERHYPVATNTDPEFPVTAKGGRKVDVPVDLPDGRTLAVEVKTYQEFRTIKFPDGTSRVERVEVPLSKELKEQINKDVALRKLDPKFDPRWSFTHAPPSTELREYLKKAKIIFLEYETITPKKR
ncbi:hypothetical protein EKH77_20835 [Streptomyces luteoverticillatus]|uniref:Uncharacterized protein n=1 Tax=Streptomyces luteoverticillatus TaxID=66425 RepID=A0A3S9PM12_STRLT|nr:hypothetical protein [Streptomyces luteoverticillatus]AZQ73334.1 hypothetical protein EKH77_20835 [Streptomyces luteoverticillatus]